MTQTNLGVVVIANVFLSMPDNLQTKTFACDSAGTYASKMTYWNVALLRFSLVRTVNDNSIVFRIQIRKNQLFPSVGLQSQMRY